MVQQILVYLTLTGALYYLGRKFYRQFIKPESGCGSNCGGCSQVDFEKWVDKKKTSQAL